MHNCAEHVPLPAGARLSQAQQVIKLSFVSATYGRGIDGGQEHRLNSQRGSLQDAPKGKQKLTAQIFGSCVIAVLTDLEEAGGRGECHQSLQKLLGQR